MKFRRENPGKKLILSGNVMKIDIQPSENINYYTEIVNFMNQYNLLIKYPQKRIADKRVLNYFWLAFGIALGVGTTAGFIISGFKWIYVVLLLTALTYIITFWLIIDGIKKKSEKYKEDRCNAQLTVDEKTVELHRNNGQRYIIPWERLQSVRFHKYCIAFVPSKGVGLCFFIPVTYKQQVEQAFTQQEKTDLLYDCTSLYK